MSDNHSLPLAELDAHTGAPSASPALSAGPSSLQILEVAVKGGVTAENVAVVKELIAMRREEMALQNKATFNRAFFMLKREIAGMEFYADKQAERKGGGVAYTYCSEAEISSKLEPVLFKHGFAMMFGQRKDGDSVVAEVTIIHEGGHEEKREYSVRTGQVNQMKDATAVDSGSTTSAWRHLVIKLFGLKSRIREDGDARNQGEFIDREKVVYIKDLIAQTSSDVGKLLAVAGAKSVEEITSGSYDVVRRLLEGKLKPRA